MQKDIRRRLVEAGKKMAPLTVGSGGNLSAKDPDKGVIWISPTAIACHQMKVGDLVGIDETGQVVAGSGKPSSETPLHLALYRLRPEIEAVVHTHSIFATTLACLHMEIPAVHYLVGLAGRKVPLAPYALFGTPELAEAVSGAMADADAALMANHGLVAVGKDPETAFKLAAQVEFVARLYYQCLAVGRPQILSRDQMDRVRLSLKSYGS